MGVMVKCLGCKSIHEFCIGCSTPFICPICGNLKYNTLPLTNQTHK